MKYIYLLALSICLISCAQFVPPTGGKKDIIPPKLLSSSPINKTLNFKEKTISLTFDEFTDVSSLKQDLLIIPQPKGNYFIKQKDKTIKLIFDDNFDPNTTYTFNFRNAIKDLSERNPAKNLKLVFATGPIIDSLSITGNVKDINTKYPVLDATFALYKIDTGVMLKRKPNYFIKTDSSGNYSLENLKSGTYKGIVFTDKNSNLLYDQKTEFIGINRDTIILSKNISLEPIEVFKANYTKNKVKKGISREYEYIMQLDKPTLKYSILNSKDSINSLLRDPQSLVIFKPKTTNNDTLKYQIMLTDSIGNNDTVNQKIYYTKPLKASKKATLTINSNIKSNEYLTKKINYIFTFDYPIIESKINKIQFKTDTLLLEEPIIKWESSTMLSLSINSVARKQIEIIIPPATFTNIKGDTSTFTYFKNQILQANDLGSLSGYTKERFGTKIAQLINEQDSKIYKEQFFTDKFNFKEVIPGNYFIKIIHDNNNNKYWDPGNILINKMPENISISKQAIKIKANFEIKDQLIE